MEIEDQLVAISKITKFSLRDLRFCYDAIKSDQGYDDAATYEWLVQTTYIAVRLDVDIITVSSILNTVLKCEVENRKKVPVHGLN